ERDWGADLAGRVSPAGPDAPRVCLLDSGVNRAHPLLAPSLSESDMHSYDRANWGVTDDFGGDAHGTLMAGLALYGDLVEPLTSRHPLPLTHRLESVKIRAAKDPQPEDHWGRITVEGIAAVEEEQPFARRVFSMAISADDGRDVGSPSAWSGALDATTCGVADGSPGRLIVLAAGNLRGHAQGSEYPTRNMVEGLCDPAQAYNALTVGADTELVAVDDPTLPSYAALASHGALSPFSRTAVIWPGTRHPSKPDVVFEGGNLALGPSGDAVHPHCLKPLTTWADHQRYLFGPVEATSAASAQVSRMAAMLWAQYPDLWPETVRALLVHSARWSPRMEHDFPDPAQRVRVYGHGRPSHERAMRSAKDALTLVIQREIQPYAGDRSNELHEYTLPWPSQVLESLGETQVTLRVALSYFIEPDPSQRGKVERYAYASHQLGFEFMRGDESLDAFRRRLNAEDGSRGGREGDGWTFGMHARHRGSLHVDHWRGDAVALARRNVLAVYPRRGWWRDRQDHDRVNRKVRYALVLSIETPEDAADLYSAVAKSTQVRALGAAVVAATR
ncbi:MAG: S8 family peptidase, partial [Polyangiales bacterium]